jgi:hypothetical protein
MACIRRASQKQITPPGHGSSTRQEIQRTCIFQAVKKKNTPSKHGSSPQQEKQRTRIFQAVKKEYAIKTRLFAPTGRRIVA